MVLLHGLVYKMSINYNPDCNLKCFRGKRIVQMCINKTPPDFHNPSSTMASNFDSVCQTQAADDCIKSYEHHTLTTHLDFIDPNYNIVVLSNNNDRDLQMFENSSQIDINTLPVVLTSPSVLSAIETATLPFESNDILPSLSTSRVLSPVNYINHEDLGPEEYYINDSSIIDNFSANHVSNQQAVHLIEKEMSDTEMNTVLQDVTDNENLPLVPYSSSSDTDNGLPVKSKTRNKKTKVNRNNWFAVKNRIQREKGSKYYGRLMKDSKWVYEKEKEPRILKERCKCKGSKMMQCVKIEDRTRQEIFHKFWKNLNWGEKKIYIDEHVKSLQTKRQRDRKNNDVSRRTQSLVYYLPGEDHDTKFRVCKTMFLNTLNIGRMSVLGWKNKLKNNCMPSEQRIATQNVPCENKKQSNLSAFFDELPVMESHYCRASTSRVYLLPEWQSKKALYDFFAADWCIKHNEKPCSTTTFFQIMEERKISLFRPKKDECEKCASYKAGNLNENEYQLHILKKDEARNEKNTDKNDTTSIVIAADAQAVLLCPVSKISILYYKTKLQVHNLCFKNLKNKDAYSYVWNESEGGVNADEFASIWIHFLETNIIPLLSRECNRIIVYSDGCGYQNRNAVLSNALLNFSVKHNVWVEQKYLEVGHTQMEVDSMHSAIERNLKNKVVNVPADYINIIKNARKEPYTVKYLEHSFFKNFDTIQAYKSIRPGRSVGDAKVNYIRGLQYSPAGAIFYKLRFYDPWAELPQRKIVVANKYFHELPDLHENRLQIKERKYQDLQQIKQVLPVDYHEFYNALPH